MKFLSIILIFSLSISANNIFFCTESIDNCQGFFIVNKPNKLEQNMLVIYSKKSKQFPSNAIDQIADCTIFSDNIAAIATKSGKLYFINFANEENYSGFIDLKKNISAIGAINDNKHSLLIVADNLLSILSNKKKNQFDPKLKNCDDEFKLDKIEPNSFRYFANAKILLSDTAEGNIFVLNNLQDHVTTGFTKQKDLFYDNEANQFEILSDNKLTSSLHEKDSILELTGLSNKIPLKFIQQELDFGMEILSTFDNSDLVRALKLTKLENDNMLLWPSAIFTEFTSKHAVKDIDRKSTRLNSSHTDISRMPSSA